MMGPGRSTVSSLDALSAQYANITNNLANAATSGFKRRSASFGQELSQAIGTDDEQAIGADGLLMRTDIDWTQGGMRPTGRTLDCAITGEGFFAVETPQGPLYTRNGVFVVNENNQLTDMLGRTVAGKTGPISVPSNASTSDIRIANDGTVTVQGRAIGQLKLVQFDSPSQLETIGASTYRATGNAAPTDAVDAGVTQGYQEGSNVSVVTELVNLISVARMYESNMKSITKYDDRLNQLLQVVSQ